MEPTKSQARRELIVAIFLRFYINKSWNQLYQDCLLSIIYYLPLLLEPTQVCDIRALVSLFVFFKESPTFSLCHREYILQSGKLLRSTNIQVLYSELCIPSFCSTYSRIQKFHQILWDIGIFLEEGLPVNVFLNLAGMLFLM